MFRHLDDPAPPAPDDSTRASVARRARRLRRRRQRQVRLTTTVSSVVVLAVLVSVGVLLGTGSSSPSGGRSAGSAHAGAGTGTGPASAADVFEDQHSPLAPGTSVPTTSLAHVIFLGPEHGYGLAEHGADVLLAATGDGGVSWRVVSDRLPAPALVPSDVEFDFTDLEHGELWAGGVSAGGPGSTELWVTDDGGRSWQQSDPGGPVLDLEPIGGDLWALVSACPPDQAAPDGSCAVVLVNSSDHGATWTSISSPGLAVAPTATTPRPDVELARITPSRAYAMEVGDNGTAPALPDWLAYTADGGAIWTDLAFPCRGTHDDLGAELAASGTNDLWLLCGGQGASGTQFKELFRSADGGQHWALAAATNGLSPATALAAGQLPPGVIAPYAFAHQNFAVLSPTEAWLFPTDGGVYRTTDGGTHWSLVASLTYQQFSNGAPGTITFISATQGWVSEAGAGLSRTTDGTRWVVLGQ